MNTPKVPPNKINKYLLDYAHDWLRQSFARCKNDFAQDKMLTLQSYNNFHYTQDRILTWMKLLRSPTSPK
jgi:hypothetical protein